MGVHRDMRRLLCAVLISGLAALFAGCGAGGTQLVEQPGANPGEAGASSSLPALPSPQALARQASAWNYAECHGADFLADVVHNRIAASATLALYSPAWRLREHHPLDDLAYGVYALQVPEFNGESKLSLLWHGSAPSAQTCWVGLGNQQRDRWDWRLLPADSVIRPQALAPYETAGRQIYVAVVLLGEEERALNGIWVGDGTHLYYEVEDNDKPETANPLPLPFAYAGVTGSVGTGHSGSYDGDNEDWYTFSLDGPQYLQLVFQRPGTLTGRVLCGVYRADGAGAPVLIRELDVFSASAELYCAQAGQYWLRLSGAGQYQFNAALASTKLTEHENNDSYLEANALHAAGASFDPVLGSLGTTEDEAREPAEIIDDGDVADWFSFVITDARSIEIQVTPVKPLQGLNVLLYGPDGATLLGWFNANQYYARPMRTALPEAGRYFIELTGNEYNHTNYRLTVRASPDYSGWVSQIIPGTLRIPGGSDAPVGHNVRGLEVGGLPALAWDNGDRNAIFFCRATAAGIAPWTVPQQIAQDASSYLSLIELLDVGGRPAAVIQSHVQDQPVRLLYLFALDKLGLAWSEPVEITIPGIDNLQVYSYYGVDGAPALCGYVQDTYSAAVYFSRAEDLTGKAWGAPVVVDTVYNAQAGWGALRLINGHPALAYAVYTDDGVGNHALVRYVQATDNVGVTWSPVADVYEYIGPGSVQLEAWAGHPVIYMTPFSLYEPYKWLVRATDSAGQSWPVPRDMNLSIGTAAVAFKELDSIPRIAWGTGSQVYYSFGEAYDGSQWAYAETVASGGGVICMFDVKGHPAIAYGGNDGLRIAYRY